MLNLDIDTGTSIWTLINIDMQHRHEPAAWTWTAVCMDRVLRSSMILQRATSEPAERK
jgi:hypothetical protein